MSISRPAVFLTLGVVLAMLSGLLVLNLAQQAASAPRQAPVDTTPIVVAAADIPEATPIAPAMVALRPYPKDLVPTGAITAVEIAITQTTLTKIPAGAPIVASQVTSSVGAAGRSAALEKGRVLVAFPIADALMTAGQIRPGDRVDILATIVPTPQATLPPGAPTLPPALAGLAALTSGPDLPTTQTIIQNLEVVDVLGKNVLAFVVDHQTSLVLKNLRDTNALVDIVIRSRLEPDPVRTIAVDNPYIIRTYRLR